MTPPLPELVRSWRWPVSPGLYVLSMASSVCAPLVDAMLQKVEMGSSWEKLAIDSHCNSESAHCSAPVGHREADREGLLPTV